MKEGELLVQARRWDRQALTEIYDLYSPKLYGYAVRLLGDPHTAEDCVADTFNRFLQALKAGKGPEVYLQAYLYRIAHNWITDYYRRQPPPNLDLEDQPLIGPNFPEQDASDQIEQAQVRAALLRLTPEQRQVVMLKFVEGLNNEVVAATLNKPVGAIKSLQHRALAALRRILDASEEEENVPFR